MSINFCITHTGLSVRGVRGDPGLEASGKRPRDKAQGEAWSGCVYVKLFDVWVDLTGRAGSTVRGRAERSEVMYKRGAVS